MRNPCLKGDIRVAVVHCLSHQEITMNRQKNIHPPSQAKLPLGNDVQWEQLPQDVRDRCRELVVQLLMDLVRSQTTGGSDER